MFYLSEYLERYRDIYYERLRAISASDDWTGWIEFFLDAITAQAKSNTDRVRQIMSLYDDMKGKIVEHTRSQYAIQVLDALFDRPIFQSPDFIKRSGIPKDSALQILRKLREANILRVIREQSGRRSAVLAFPDLLNRAEGRDVLLGS